MKTLWKSMIQRCHNPRNPSYASYGGRGITVCAQWRSNFVRFVIDVGPRPAGATIDRIDNERGYEPGNVRWATRKEQAQNRYTTRLIAHLGIKKTITEWARSAGLHSNTLGRRLDHGWPMERALTTPVDRRFQRRNKVGSG